jgi:hypothetical protein
MTHELNVIMIMTHIKNATKSLITISLNYQLSPIHYQLTHNS